MNKPIIIRLFGAFAIVLGLYDLLIERDGNSFRSLLPIALGLGAIALSFNKGQPVA
jgi:hypothetical protein